MSRLLVVGHLTLDAVCNQTTLTATFDLPQGAALGSAAGAAVAGAQVDLVAVVGSDYPAQVIEALGQAGINTSYIEERQLPTLRFWLLRESGSFSIDHPYHTTPIPAYTPVLESLPEEQIRNLDAAHICPMPIEDQLTWVRQLKGNVDLISVDPQPFRFAAPGIDIEQLFGELLSEVDVLAISLEDFPGLIAENVSATLRDLLDRGPRVVTLKMGGQGSAVAAKGDRRYLSVKPVSGPVLDETGAGDAYAGAFLATYAATGDLLESARRATSTAYVTIKEIGVLHVLSSISLIDTLTRQSADVVEVDHPSMR